MKLTRMFLPLILAGIITGCDSTTTTSSEGAPETPKIALVMKSLANEFFKTMEDGAKTYHAEHAETFTLLANGIKNEEDIAGQVALVENMIVQGVDAIVIAPADSKALIAVLARAMKEGIQVVNIDNKLDAEVLAQRQLSIPFVGPDNRKGARLAGEHLAGQLQAGDSVALINGVPSAFNAIQRRLGFEESMKAAGMTIVADQSAHWEMAKANQVAAGILSEHPDLKAILCGNDSMALGAVAALKDAGRAEVRVVGFDNISAVQELIKQSKVLATVDQHGDKLAVFGIEYALQILASGTTPADKETPVDLILVEDLK
jgi:ribose transport system substrate-binding protein